MLQRIHREHDSGAALRDAVLLREDPFASRPSGLGERLHRMGFDVGVVPNESDLRRRLSRSARPHAVLVNVGLGSSQVQDTLLTTHRSARNPLVTVLAIGDEPQTPIREILRHAGVSLAAFGSVDDHTLRFQVNRAFLADRSRGPARGELRAPLDWEISVEMGTRRMSGRVYSLSRGGLFLEVVRPARVGTQVRFELPLPSGAVPMRAEVVHTNPPGYLRTLREPIGMGLRFESPDRATTQAIDAVLADRCSRLLV